MGSVSPGHFLALEIWVPLPRGNECSVSLGISCLWKRGFPLPPEILSPSPVAAGICPHRAVALELQKQTEVERQKIVAECKELRAFLEEKEQLLLSRLEELERDIGRRRDESVAQLAEDIAQLDKLLAEQGGDSGTGSTPGEVGLCCVFPKIPTRGQKSSVLGKNTYLWG